MVSINPGIDQAGGALQRVCCVSLGEEPVLFPARCRCPPRPVLSTVTYLAHHSVFLPGVVRPFLPLSTHILAEKEPMLSYPTLPKGGPMLSTLPSFPNPITHQLVED